MKTYNPPAALALCAAMILLMSPASADINYGAAARSIGMGGAGLAVVDNPLAASAINPAAMGLSSRRFYLSLPSFDVREEGASLTDLTNSLDDIADTSIDGAVTLAREFGSHDTRLGLNAYAGAFLLHGSVGLGGEAVASILPNEAFKLWVADGIRPLTPTDARADVTADAIYYVPSVAFGWKANVAGPGRLYLGLRGKRAKSRHFVQAVQLNADPQTLELSVGKSGPQIDVDDSGVGIDAGAIYCAADKRQTTYGLSITNLLRPSLRGIEQDSVVNLGISTRPVSRVLVAADLVNVTGSYNDHVGLRLGTELQLMKRLALRAGYSGDGLTFGVGAFGIDLAFSADAPLTIGQTLRF